MIRRIVSFKGMHTLYQTAKIRLTTDSKYVTNLVVVKAKFHYEIWFEPASNQLQTSQRNGIWL